MGSKTASKAIKKEIEEADFLLDRIDAIAFEIRNQTSDFSIVVTPVGRGSGYRCDIDFKKAGISAQRGSIVESMLWAMGQFMNEGYKLAAGARGHSTDEIAMVAYEILRRAVMFSLKDGTDPFAATSLFSELPGVDTKLVAKAISSLVSEDE